MTQETPLSITDITQELNSGPATIKFILNRFSAWLPFDRIDGYHYYSRKTIPVLIKIKESLEAGMLPSEIDQELKTTTSPETDGKTTTDNYFLENPNEDIRVSKDGLSLIKSLFDDISVQQSRVATAHEKRAEAEERKAVAIEKRAEAEEKKASAMNNIAMALQEMNRQRLPDSQTREMAQQAVQVLTDDETSPEMGLTEFNNTEQQDFSDIFDSPEPPSPIDDLLETSEIDMDDLSELIEDDILLDDPLVDIHHIPEQNPTEESKKPSLEKESVDDLSALIDTEEHHSPKTQEVLDDLSTLLDNPTQTSDDMDDLSALIDTPPQAPAKELGLDDLSLLIDDTPSTPLELDNLSLLIDAPIVQEIDAPIAQEIDDPIPAKIDDLSLLITPDSPPPMDDLGALIDKAPSLKPDITPEENLKEYKAAVMKTILQLKTEGVSANEATDRLNQDGVQTISGKPQWSETAISQIYKFIDSAK